MNPKLSRIWDVFTTAVVALVLRLDVLWVCIAMYCETFLKTPIGLVRFRSKKWINDVTVME